MPTQVSRRQTLYGYPNPQAGLQQEPIVANRAPTTADTAEIGVTWVNQLTNIYYVLTSSVQGVNTWIASDNGGAPGVFSSLTVNPGPTDLSTVGNGAVTIGNAANTGAVTINVGTGNFDIVGNGNSIGIGDDGTSNSIVIGSTAGTASLQMHAGTSGVTISTANTGTILLGSNNMSGAITIGNSAFSGQPINIGVQGNNTIAIGSAGSTGSTTLAAGTGGVAITGNGNGITIGTDANPNTIGIGNITAGTNVTILSGAAGGTLLVTSATGTIQAGDAGMTGTITIGASTAGQIINIGNALNVGAQTINIASGNSGANSAVNILNGVATAGAKTFNLMASGGQPSFVNIANGAAVNTVIMGSITGAASTTIRGGTSGITLTAPFVALPGPVYLYTGAGVPSNALALHVGDLYINTTAAAAGTRLYIATGVGAWTFFTANA